MLHYITTSVFISVVYSVLAGITAQQNMASVYRNLHQKYLLRENCDIMQHVITCQLRSENPTPQNHLMRFLDTPTMLCRRIRSCDIL